MSDVHSFVKYIKSIEIIIINFIFSIDIISLFLLISMIKAWE